MEQGGSREQATRGEPRKRQREGRASLAQVKQTKTGPERAAKTTKAAAGKATEAWNQGDRA